MSRRLFGELLEQRLKFRVRRGVSDFRLELDQRAILYVRIAGDLQKNAHISVIPGKALGQDARKLCSSCG